jgi:hypothetical protein
VRWLVALALGIAGAAWQYGGRLPRRLPAPLAPAALRAASDVLVLAVLFNAPAGVPTAPRPWVALDVSASMRGGAGSPAWRSALDSVSALHADSLFLFGDSLRAAPRPAAPGDLRSDVDPVIQRAIATGRPVVVVTDGLLTQGTDLQQLPAGSRVILARHATQPDAGLAALDAPRAVVGGDSVEIWLDLVAGGAGSPAGSLSLTAGGASGGTLQVAPLAAFQRRRVAVHVRAPAREGPTLLRAVLSVPGDAEPGNDTLAVGLDVSRQPGAVFVSTAPDYDARFALSVLRGALSLPTRAYYHLSPGNWRLDGGFARATEAEVRAAFRDAPVAVLQGDTAVFGPPRSATRAPLALIVPAQGDGAEWFASAVPASPLSGALADVLWDPLPPLLVGPGVAPTGQWHGLEARRARTPETRAIVAGDDGPRRVVVVAASDLWRWKFRGGVAADAYTALWGSIFDYLAAQRADRRAAVPDAQLFRAGDPVTWRRGAGADSVVIVQLRRREGGAGVTDTLRFLPGSGTARSAPLAPGIYDVAAPGGASLLVVNASAEWVPAPPTVKAGPVGGRPARGSAPSSRDAPWMYLLLVATLCAEWILRRRAGLR